jgi:stringent starvation protein B
MISTKPYLIRAIREWAIDNGLTPEIMVNANFPGVIVPMEFVNDGQIALNVHDVAVDVPVFGNENIQFSARFRGVPMTVDVPVDAVQAVYARENRLGIFFQNDDQSKQTEAGDGDEGPGPKGHKKPDLKIVK